jgi:hypothetical protein
MTDENEENIRVSFKVWKKFYQGYYGIPFYFCLFFCLTLIIVSQAANDYIIG